MFRGKRLLLVFCLLGIVGTACSVLGYSAGSDKWTRNRTVAMHLSLGGPAALQDGFPSFNASAADALRQWNAYLAHMQFGPIEGSSLTPEDGDSDNSVFFTSTVYGKSFGRNVLAVTLTSIRGPITTEADVLFNSAISWNSYHGPLQGSVQDFHRVALHEFGHVVGLNHPDENGQKVVAIMNSTVSNLETLQTDDINGARSIYDNGPPYLATTASSNLGNLSTRALVGTGDRVLIGGLIIQGSQPTTVILRAVGHSLGARGVTNALTDPQIELRNASGTLVAQNDDWIDSVDAETIASYRLDPPNSTESAILRTLSAGNYTAIVKAFDNGDGNLTGTGLFEIYEVQGIGGRAGNIAYPRAGLERERRRHRRLHHRWQPAEGGDRARARSVAREPGRGRLVRRSGARGARLLWAAGGLERQLAD